MKDFLLEWDQGFLGSTACLLRSPMSKPAKRQGSFPESEATTVHPSVGIIRVCVLLATERQGQTLNFFLEVTST